MAATGISKDQFGLPRPLLGLAVGGLLMLATSFTSAQAILPQSAFEDLPVQSTSSRMARLESTRHFPFSKLSPEARRRVQYVVAKPTLFRRIKTNAFECDPDLFVFLVRHPEVVVNTWQLMGVTRMKVQRTGPYRMHVNDGQGTVSDVEMMYGIPTQHIVYADGYYEGPLFGRKLRAKCAFVMNSQYSRYDDGRPMVRCQLDIFVRVENLGADLLTKTLRPIACKMADYNFSESTQFISQVSRAAANNGPAMRRLAQRLADVDPAVRQQFVQLTTAVSGHELQTVSAEIPAVAIGTSTLPGAVTAASPHAPVNNGPRKRLFQRR